MSSVLPAQMMEQSEGKTRNPTCFTLARARERGGARIARIGMVKIGVDPDLETDKEEALGMETGGTTMAATVITTVEKRRVIDAEIAEGVMTDTSAVERSEEAGVEAEVGKEKDRNDNFFSISFHSRAKISCCYQQSEGFTSITTIIMKNLI